METLKLTSLELRDPIRIGSKHMSEKFIRSDKFDITLFPSSGLIKIIDRKEPEYRVMSSVGNMLGCNWEGEEQAKEKPETTKAKGKANAGSEAEINA